MLLYATADGRGLPLPAEEWVEELLLLQVSVYPGPNPEPNFNPLSRMF